MACFGLIAELVHIMVRLLAYMLRRRMNIVFYLCCCLFSVSIQGFGIYVVAICILIGFYFGSPDECII